MGELMKREGAFENWFVDKSAEFDSI